MLPTTENTEAGEYSWEIMRILMLQMMTLSAKMVMPVEAKNIIWPVGLTVP